MRTSVISGIVALSFLVACTTEQDVETAAAPGSHAANATLVDDAAMADESAGENWLAYGRTYSEQRFSPLDQINAGNVSGLGVDWYMDLPNARGLVSTPLVVDGVMYFVESMNRIRAVNATSGESKSGCSIRGLPIIPTCGLGGNIIVA